MLQNLGKMLVVLGIVLVIVGLVLWAAGGKLAWFGRLPGDIRIERPGLQVYVPITTMILVSVALSALMWAFGRFFK